MAQQGKSIAALKRERTRRLARIGARAYYLRRRGREQEMYNFLCSEFLELGGVYVKFMQGVLFNSPVMKRWQSPARLKIFENLDTQPINVVALLQHELPSEQLRDIALVQPEPFAAGSFGQVYMAQHTNGQKIVIKVLRPMVRELLRYDLRLLSMFGKRFAAQEYSNFNVKMDTAIKEFRFATLNETDYVTEAQFAAELYEVYKGHPFIVIPRTYLELCTPHIIVQEFVDGISGAELLKQQAAGVDPATYIHEQLGSDLDTQLLQAGVESMISVFKLPRIPGDPHPGNIRFMTDNRIGLIDFGISAPVPRNRAAFYGLLLEWSRVYEENTSVVDLFGQFMRYFVNDLYRALKKLSAFTGGMQSLPGLSALKGEKSGGDLVDEIGRIVQDAFDSATGASDFRTLIADGQMLHAFGQVANKDNRLGLVIRLESSEVLRAAQTYIALLNSLNRNSLYPLILAQATEIIARDNPGLIHDTEDSLTTTQAISIINRWLERVAMKDPLLFRQLLQRISPREEVAQMQTKEVGDA
jgi:serine/threonine protein kinase